MLLALNQPHSVTLEALAHSHGLPGTDIEGVAAKTSREDSTPTRLRCNAVDVRPARLETTTPLMHRAFCPRNPEPLDLLTSDVLISSRQVSPLHGPGVPALTRAMSRALSRTPPF